MATIIINNGGDRRWRPRGGSSWGTNLQEKTEKVAIDNELMMLGDVLEELSEGSQ